MLVTRIRMSKNYYLREFKFYLAVVSLKAQDSLPRGAQPLQ